MSDPLEKNCTDPASAIAPVCVGITTAVRVTLEPCVIVALDVVTLVLVVATITVSLDVPEEVE